MERNILMELQPVFREVFGDETIQLNRNTSAVEIEDWDSLTHIELIVAVEQHFGIQFKSMDLKKLENVGDLADLVKTKLSA